MALSKQDVLDTVVGYVQLINTKYKVNEDTKWDDLGVDPDGRLDYYDGIRAGLEQKGATFKTGFKRFGLRKTQDMKSTRDFFWDGME